MLQLVHNSLCDQVTSLSMMLHGEESSTSVSTCGAARSSPVEPGPLQSPLRPLLHPGYPKQQLNQCPCQDSDANGLVIILMPAPILVP